MIALEARRMLRAHRYGALCTLSKRFNGHPLGSITPYLVDQDGSLLILISTLAEHTKNILSDPRVSLITHDPRDAQILAQGRVTAIGTALQEPDHEQFGWRYLNHFPESKTYFSMHDFSFFRIRPEAIRYIGGFSKIHWVDMEKFAVGQAGKFSECERASLAEVNKNQTVLRNMLRLRHNIGAQHVEEVGFDCDGLDVRCGDLVLRLDFPETITNPSPNTLVEMLAKSQQQL